MQRTCIASNIEVQRSAGQELAGNEKFQEALQAAGIFFPVSAESSSWLVADLGFCRLSIPTRSQLLAHGDPPQPFQLLVMLRAPTPISSQPAERMSMLI